MRIDTFSRVLLLFGFLGTGLATREAYRSPATGYELSIYAGTPTLFWALSSFALLVSVLVVFGAVGRPVRFLGGFLGGLTMTVIVSLPIIRGYHFIGTGDSLSHLGTASDMNAGLLPLIGHRYPVVHPLGSILHDITGLELNEAMLLVIVVFTVSYFVFIPLTVRELTGDGWATYIALFSGLLLLPMNHLSPSIYIHPTSQALMYAPAFLFVFFLMYRLRIARNSLMFLLVAPMFVMLHPQQAANLLLFFGMIAGLQIGFDVLNGHGFSRRANWVLPEVAVFAIAFWLWVRNLGTFWSSLESVYMIPFEDTQVAETTATRNLSLTEVGGSLPEVFLKLFSVQLVYVFLTGVLAFLIIRSLWRVSTQEPSETLVSDGGTDPMLPVYVVGGIIAVSGMFAVFLIGGISDQYFRHLGMLMVFGSILGSIELARGMRVLERTKSTVTSRRVMAMVLVVFIALSLPVVFASPYIYYSSNHVTEIQMSGYETTFAIQNDSIVFEDIRSSTSRYGNAILGRQIPSEAYYRDVPITNVPDHFNNQSLRAYYNQSIYIPVPEADRIRDPILWNGFRFSHEDFEYLDSEHGVHRVQSNGGYDLYLVTPAELRLDMGFVDIREDVDDSDDQTGEEEADGGANDEGEIGDDEANGADVDGQEDDPDNDEVDDEDDDADAPDDDGVDDQDDDADGPDDDGVDDQDDDADAPDDDGGDEQDDDADGPDDDGGDEQDDDADAPDDDGGDEQDDDLDVPPVPNDDSNGQEDDSPGETDDTEATDEDDEEEDGDDAEETDDSGEGNTTG